MMSTQAPGRSRSPTQMSPLLQKLLEKHGMENQQLISHVIYNYARKGIKLRDLTFEKVDQDVQKAIADPKYSVSGGSGKYRSALRKGPRESNDSRVQFDPGMPKIIEQQRAHTIQKTKPRDGTSFRSPSPPRIKDNLMSHQASTSRLQNQSLERAVSQLEQSQSQIIQRSSPQRNQLQKSPRLASMRRESSKMFELINGGEPDHIQSPGKRNVNYNTISAAEKRSSTQQRYPTPTNASQERLYASAHHRNASASILSPSSNAPSDQFKAAQDIKPLITRRDESISRPKNLNMWDMLTLQDTLKKQQEDKAIKELDAYRKVKLREYYDMQVEQKKRLAEQETTFEMQLRNQMDHKVELENDRDDKISYKHKAARVDIARQNQRQILDIKDVRQLQNAWIKEQYISKKQIDDHQNNAFENQARKLVEERKKGVRQEQLVQMNIDKQKAKLEKVVDRDFHLKNLVLQDNNFIRRDARLEDHKRAVEDKKIRMENYFMNPEIKTHAKSEVDKEVRIAKLQQKMDLVEQQRVQVRERDKFAKVFDYKDKMMSENNDLITLRKNKKMAQVAQYIANKEAEQEKQIYEVPRRHQESGDSLLHGLLSPKKSRLSGLPQIVPNFPQKETDHATIYNQSPKVQDTRITTRRQVAHQIDMQQFQQITKEKQRLMKELLDHQVHEKVIRKEKDRLYKDEKELATSKQLLKAIHPHIAQNTSVITSPLRNNKKISDAQEGLIPVSIRGKPQEMGQHDAILANEVNKLHQMVVNNEIVKKTSLL